MKKMPGLVSSALVSVLLFACGDDKGGATGATGPTNATNNTTDVTTDDTTTQGMSETGAPDPTTSGTTSAPNPTTGALPDTDSEGTTDATGGFLIPPDGGGGAKECNQWSQDCPEGQKCMPYSGDGDNSWESLKCTAVMENAGAVGDPCTVEGSGVSGIDNCEKGAMCWDVTEGIGICVAQCIGSPDAPNCAQPMTSCLISNDGVLTLCLPFCDPLLQDCPGDDLCIPNPQDNNAFLCVLDASGDGGAQYDACEYINACDPGFLCANPTLGSECDPMAIGCCMPFCDTTEMGVCTGMNQVCIPWYEEGQGPPGLESVGVCGIPQ